MTARIAALKRLARNFVSWQQSIPRAGRVPARWHRKQAIDPTMPLCVFVMLPREGKLLPHSIEHARAWHLSGYQVVCVIIVDTVGQQVDFSALDFASGILGRLNRGYDFGAWAGVVAWLRREIGRTPRLVLANDSVIGPSDRFAEMADRIAQSPADVIALVESRERRHHFQSFVMAFNPRALNSRTFRGFWKSVRSGDRAFVINNYELMLCEIFEAGGLTIETIFPLLPESTDNPTLSRWRELVAAGFPFIKVDLLRTDPFSAGLGGWRAFCESQGFDLAMLDRQIASLRGGVPTRWAIDSAAL